MVAPLRSYGLPINTKYAICAKILDLSRLIDHFRVVLSKQNRHSGNLRSSAKQIIRNLLLRGSGRHAGDLGSTLRYDRNDGREKAYY